jgi:acetyl esterase
MQPPDLTALLIEQRRANERLALDGQRVPPPGAVPVERMRRARQFNPDGSSKLARAPRAADRELSAPRGAIKVREFPRQPSQGLYIHFHGGGWVFGSIHEQDHLLDALGNASGLTVVSVDYPLAPEHELPEILAHAIAATRSVIETYGHGKVCLGGESAGAHIAVNVALDLCRDLEHAAKIVGLNLCYGIFDLSMTPSQRSAGDAFVGLSRPYLEWFYSLALPGRTQEQRRDPDVSPLYRDLARMPACLFSVGELDPLLDDTQFMAARWRAAGNPTDLKVYPQAHHGFNGQSTSMATLANDAIHRFLADCVKRPPATSRPAAEETPQ